MPLYHYKAVEPNGELREGDMEALEESAVVAQLQDEGAVPIEVELNSLAQRRLPWVRLKGLNRARLSRQEVSLFTEELATLLSAGLPLDRALQILLDLAETEGFRRLVDSVYEQVRGGAAFSTALEAQQGVFSKLYINMVKAGEAAGALDAALASLSEYLQRVKQLRDSVVSALIYPTILVLVAGMSVILLLTYVVPQFTQMFLDMGSALPFSTQVVVTLGELLRGYWWSFPLVALVLILFVRHQYASPERRLRWDRYLLRLPLVGELVTKIEVARFSRTLGVLLTNGVALLGALSIVKDIMNNRVLAEAVATAADSLQAGQRMAEPLTTSGVFPKLVVQMISVGEESGRLEDMLIRVADVYEREVTTTVQRLLALLEPVLIVGLGVIIAGIIISILVAILSVNQLVF